MAQSTSSVRKPSAASAKKKTSATSKSVKSKKRRKEASPRVRRVKRAFVASASLRPMAQQLLQDRNPAAYAGVETYARQHAKEDAAKKAAAGKKQLPEKKHSESAKPKQSSSGTEGLAKRKPR